MINEYFLYESKIKYSDNFSEELNNFEDVYSHQNVSYLLYINVTTTTILIVKLIQKLNEL